jgi:prophage DNA circulation protein
MAFDTEIREAKYTSPSGASFVLQFDKLDRAGGKKAAIHEGPQQNAPDVQDLGNSAEKYPMSVYFTGEESQNEADDLWAALSETGQGTLAHPRWGNIPVLPLSWTQAENKVEGLGRVDFTIDFLRCSADSPYPTTNAQTAETVNADTETAMDAGDAASAADYMTEDAADTASIAEEVTRTTKKSDTIFGKLVALSETLQASFVALNKKILATVNDLVGDEMALFNATRQMVMTGSKVATKTIVKVAAYRQWAETVIEFVPETIAQAALYAQNMYVALGGTIEASVSGEVASRNEAVLIADELEETGALIFAAIEAVETAIPEFRADPETVAALADSLATSRELALERAYSLKSERRVVIATDRTPLDVLAEFYGDGIDDLDDALDEFIKTNMLQGNERIVIPAGREVVYYA